MNEDNGQIMPYSAQTQAPAPVTGTSQLGPIPHDSEAETAIIASMLFDSECVNTAIEMLKPEDFYRGDLRLIYEAMTTMFLRGEPIDLITLKNKLATLGTLEQAGGMDALVRIAGAVATGAHIKHYAQIVVDKAILRRLIRASSEIAQKSFEAQDPVDTIVDFAEKSIFDILQNRNSSNFYPLQEVLVAAISKIEEIYLSGQRITGVMSGFPDLDNRTAGFQPSDLVLIAARPSMGKTALALNIAAYAAFHKNVPTAIFSLEMSREQIATRLLCSESMIDSQKLRTGTLNEDDWLKMAETVSIMAGSKIYIDDTPGVTPGEIRAKCRKLKLEKGLGLIVIDYLQLMSSGKKSESRQNEVSEISRALKAVAREMEAPVILLSQLSRACEQRADKRPMLSDLRESGAIEQDADVVNFIYRDEYYNPDTEKKGIAEIIIAKQRNGPTGTVDLLYWGKYTRFANIEDKTR